MPVPPLHPWNLSPRAAIALQRRLAACVRLAPLELASLRSVAGVDVSYACHGGWFYAGVVVLEFPSLRPLAEATWAAPVSFPYIPGLLSFRELPVLLAAFRQLSALPDAILVDGQGIAHPRRFGLASHLGLWLDRPTVGCAKHRLCGTAAAPGLRRGEQAPLTEAGEVLGTVLRTRDGVRPLYVSPGHRCDIAAAVALTLACGGGYRLPEPTRLAHLLTNRARREAASEPASLR